MVSPYRPRHLVEVEMILTRESTKDNLEDRITYLLSEWLNDNAPLGQERYRAPAKAVIEEFRKWPDIGRDVVRPGWKDLK